jgi:hypothetical protein
VRILSASNPASRRRPAAASTKPFDPQTNAVPESKAASAISEESIRPVCPDYDVGTQPGY